MFRTLSKTILIAGLVAACSGRNGADRTLAKIGAYAVSDDHFLRAYEITYKRTGSAMPINMETKKAVLEGEFDKYVLATYARDIRLHESEPAVRRAGMLRRQLLVDQFLKEQLFDTLQTDQNLARELFRRSKTFLRASHLFTTSKATADSLYDLLRTERATFEALAASLFKSNQLATSGGDLGLFTVDDMDMAFEEAAYRLRVGEISPPVKTVYGYSIIKLTGFYPEPIITEQQYLEAQPVFEQLADKRLRFMVGDLHLEDVVNSFTFNDAEIDRLWDEFNQSGDSKPKQALSSPATADENTWIARKEGMSVSLADVKSEFFYTPDETLRKMTNRQRFMETVKGMVYRNAVCRLATALKMDRSERFKGNYEYAFASYLASAVETQIAAETYVPEESIKQYWNLNSEFYYVSDRLNLQRLIVGTRAEAEKISGMMISKGLSFTAAVRQFTLDTENLRIDGQMGWVPVSELGMLGSTLSQLSIGEISKPIEYQTNRVHVYKLLGREKGRPMSYEEAVPVIRDELQKQVVGSRMDILKKEIRNKHQAFVDYRRLETMNVNI